MFHNIFYLFNIPYILSTIIWPLGVSAFDVSGVPSGDTSRPKKNCYVLKYIVNITNKIYS